MPPAAPSNTSSPREHPVPDASYWNDVRVLICTALATVVIHLILGNRYGIHRDELATLDDARHLAWGYVAYPPVTPFFGRLSLALFGTSIRGFRFCLGGGVLMQYVAFDCLAWVMTAYFVVLLLKSDDAGWWLAIGVSLGFGMLCKWTIGFFTLSIVAAVLLTDARTYLKSKWLWFGVALSILIFLPNLLWQ